ncbi:G5 domain-containing protein [Actinoplanes sp. NPDC051346]|uniref:G5 domain-containing protein n=1 Tax=Actinoplanes sp. NPDC051346 TaxID=3155048 RepID=UPI003418F76A
MPDNEPRWYDEIPSRGLWRVRRRDRLEFAIAAVLLTGLLGLLIFGVSREAHERSRPAPASSSDIAVPVDSPRNLRITRTEDLVPEEDVQTVRVMNPTSAWSRLRPLQKGGLIVAALALPIGGAFAIVSAFSDDDANPAWRNADQVAASAAPSTPPPLSSGTDKRTVTETEPIKFKTRTVKDNWLAKGEKELRTEGIDGVRTKTYEVTYVDGKEKSRKELKSEVTRKPVDQVTAVGAGQTEQ